MCHRCQWPFAIEIDEDQSDESFTSDIKPADQRMWKMTWDKTYVPKRRNK